MDLTTLEGLVGRFFTGGLASRTSDTYSSAKCRYLEFCYKFGLSPLPLSEHVLCLFAAFLSKEGLRSQSIAVYLSGVRHLEICSGGTPERRDKWPRLQYVLRGIARSQVGTPHRLRLPITCSILSSLKNVWSQGDFQSRLLWAATCVGFFGFLRVGEFTVASEQHHPCIVFEDVAVDSHTHPSIIRLRLRHAKMDPFGKGVDVYLGASGSAVCPVTALLGFLAVRPLVTGQLFVWQDGKALSRSAFVAQLRVALRSAGIDDAGFSGHSLRIGAATAAAAAGIPDHTIKMLGRWQSEAYHLYIRTPRETLAGYSRLLGANC